MNGVISTWIRIGSAKKNQNSCTSGGVVRNNSTMKPAGIDSMRQRDRRSSASPSPSGTPKASAVPVSCSVLPRPAARAPELASTGAKSQLYMASAASRRSLHQASGRRVRAA